MRHKGYIKRIPIVKFVKNIKLKKSVYGVVDFFLLFSNRAIAMGFN